METQARIGTNEARNYSRVYQLFGVDPRDSGAIGKLRKRAALISGYLSRNPDFVRDIVCAARAIEQSQAYRHMEAA